MANTLSAMMTSIAMSAMTPPTSAVPIMVPRQFQTKVVSPQNTAMGTAAGGISISAHAMSEGGTSGRNVTWDRGITLTAWDQEAAELVALAANKTWANY